LHFSEKTKSKVTGGKKEAKTSNSLTGKYLQAFN